MSKIIEAKAVISAEDRTGAVFDKIGKKFKDLGKGAKVSAEVDRLGKSLERIAAHQKAFDTFQAKTLSFGAARTRFREAQVAVEAAAKALAGADKPTKALEASLKRARKEVGAAAEAFDREKAAVLGAKQALAGFGGSLAQAVKGQRQLAAEADRTAAALERQQRRAHRAALRRETLKNAATGAGAAAGYKGKQIALDAISSAAEFDIAVRKQRVFTDINASEQAGLLSQAKRIGQETQFSNIDVVHAQTASMQGLPAGFAPALKAEVAKGIVDNVRNYATLMETDLKEGAETIRAYLQQTGKDISSKEKAIKEANRATNQLVKMAKLGGMNGEDVKLFMNYAASPGTSANLSSETLMSLAALARRGGLRGDEAGTFIRTASSKMVAPTAGGITALNAAGIRFSDYVGMPERLSTDRLENQFQLKTGKAFTPEIRARLEAINADKRLLADRAAYVSAVTDAVSPILGKKKDGTVRASDSRIAAKAAGEFHKVSASSVDTERLLDDAMSKGMTLPQLNAWLTDKHGGKGAITQRQWEEFKTARGEIKKAGDDPDFAAKKAAEVMAGLGGSIENLKGSWENLVLNIGQANESLIKFSADGIGKALDAFSNLSTTSQQTLSLVAAAGAASGGIFASIKVLNALLGTGGGAAALTGSAAALDISAGLLSQAALALGAKGVVPGAAGAVASTGAGAAVGTAGRLAAGIPIVGAGIGVGALFLEGQDAKKGIVHGGRPDPGVTLDAGDELPGLSPPARSASPPPILRDAPAAPRVGPTPSPSGAPIKATVDQPVPVSVSGELTGQVAVKVDVSVSPTSELITAVGEAKQATMQIRAAIRAAGVVNGSGSTGKASPDAGVGGRN